MTNDKPLTTPDGRYIVVRDRLWRASNPGLSELRRVSLVSALMDARWEIARSKNDPDAMKAARRKVHEAKLGLGERGPVWWTDGKPDLNRHLIKNTDYARWYEKLGGAVRKAR